MLVFILKAIPGAFFHPHNNYLASLSEPSTMDSAIKKKKPTNCSTWFIDTFITQN